jgi:hypothetical protein
MRRELAGRSFVRLAFWTIVLPVLARVVSLPMRAWDFKVASSSWNGYLVNGERCIWIGLETGLEMELFEYRVRNETAQELV